VHKRVGFNGKNYLAGTQLTIVSTNRLLKKNTTAAVVAGEVSTLGHIDHVPWTCLVNIWIMGELQ
jgi:hypothetical protein